MNDLPNVKYDAIVLAVAYKESVNLDFGSLKKEISVIYDVKGILGNKADKRL